jgi:hypothetical protein
MVITSPCFSIASQLLRKLADEQDRIQKQTLRTTVRRSSGYVSLKPPLLALHIDVWYALRVRRHRRKREVWCPSTSSPKEEVLWYAALSPAAHTDA